MEVKAGDKLILKKIPRVMNFFQTGDISIDDFKLGKSYRCIHINFNIIAIRLKEEGTKLFRSYVTMTFDKAEEYFSNLREYNLYKLLN